MDKIITAKDYAAREGVKTITELIRKTSNEMVRRHVLDTPFDDSEVVGKPVNAEIDWGQWIARCECGGAETVDPDEPIFYCFSCGNYDNHGKPRPVIFPKLKEREQIEREILKRPVKITKGTHMIERLTNAVPQVFDMVDGKLMPLSRSWAPQESVKEIVKQNKVLKKKAGK